MPKRDDGKKFNKPRSSYQNDYISDGIVDVDLDNGLGDIEYPRLPENIASGNQIDINNFKLFKLRVSESIDKRFAVNYKSKMEEESFTLYSLTNNTIAKETFCIDIRKYFGKYFYHQRNLSQLLKAKNDEVLKDTKGGNLSLFMIIILLIVPESMLRVICRILEPFVNKIYTCLCNSSEQFRFFPEETEDTIESRLHDTLRKSKYSFIVSAMTGVLPNLITTIVYSIIIPQIFMMDSCHSTHDISNHIPLSSFNESCQVTFLWNYPNYPTQPAISYSSSSIHNMTYCSGISSGIIENIGPYDIWIDLQYIIYTCVLIYGLVLTIRETQEKSYVRKAIYHHGIYISRSFIDIEEMIEEVEEQTTPNVTNIQNTSTTTPTTEIGNNNTFTSYISCNCNFIIRTIIPKNWIIFFKKAKTKRLNIFQKILYGGLSPHLDYLFILCLCGLYIVTLAYSTPNYATWYVFPESLYTQGQAFHETYSSSSSSSSSTSSINMNWCNILKYPIVLRYIKNDRVSLSTAFLQGIYFIYCTVQLLLLQEKEYDFIDGDEMLCLHNSEFSCVYSGIESYKHRFFSDEMLDDWYVAFVLYPVWYDIVNSLDPHYEEIRSYIGTDEYLELIQNTLERIRQKCLHVGSSGGGSGGGGLSATI